MSRWVWVEVPPTGGADASTGAGIFKNWGDTSELLAREVIQNSWDAAQGYREDDPSHDFEVVFRFEDLEGDRKARFVEALDLRQLFEQRVHLQREDSLARLEASALGRLGDDAPLSVLCISDYGAHGLYGAPALRRESHLYKALYTLGVTGKNDAGLTSGGSFGFGKGAFIRASRTGTVVAYSSFEPRPESPFEDAITRRLIGWTFWSGHEADGVERDGRAWFGAVGAPGSAEPYVDDEADRIASSLGLSARTSVDRTQLGTTLLIVDPTVHAETLCAAIEKYWWPAIEYVDGFTTLVVAADGTELHPRPKSRPDLRPFLRAYELASFNTSGGHASADYKIASFPKVEGLPTGTMAQVLDVSESETSPDTEAELAGRQTPVIAFMRRPRMVVEYREPSRARVPTRGVYVASDDLDPYLKRTEPAGHEKWEMRSGDDDTETERHAKELALRVYRLIQDEVRSFAREAEPPRAVGGVPLGHFGELVGKFAGSGRGPLVPPIGEHLPISLVPTYDIEPNGGDDRIALLGTVDVQCTDGESRQVRIWAVLALREEQRVGARIPIELKHLEGAHSVQPLPDGSLVAALDSNDHARFSIRSDPYDHRWESRLAVNVELIESASESVPTEEAL